MLNRISIMTYYPLMVFLALSLVGLSGAIYVVSQQKDRIESAFNEDTRKQAQELLSQITSHQRKVEIIANHFVAHQWVTSHEFNRFNDTILGGHLKETTINLLALLNRDDLILHVQKRIKEFQGVQNYSLHIREQDGKFQELEAGALPSEDNILISLHYPTPEYFRQGMVLRNNAPLVASILAAERTRKTQIVRLFHEETGNKNDLSVVITVPANSRQPNIKGSHLVSATLNIGEILSRNLASESKSQTNNYLIYPTKAGGPMAVYDLNSGKPLPPVPQAFASLQDRPLQYREEMTMGSVSWTLLITPKPGFYEIDLTLPLLTQLIALLIAASLASLVKRTILQTRLLHEEVNQRITELKKSNEQHEKERIAMEGVANGNIAVAERYLHIKEESEANNRLLNVVMDTLNQGICAFSPEMTLLKWNNNLESILGLPKGTVTVGILYKVLTKHLDQISYQPSPGDMTTATGTRSTEESYLKQDISYFERNLQDGRTLEISMTPMPNGGFIVVYLDITERKKAERIIRHMAHFDSLTGLANRAHFSEKLDGLLNQKRQSDETIALALIDLDNFKSVNDTFGHPMGDALLQRVSEILKYQIRDNDFAARVGGDEFAILFPNINDLEEIMIPLRRMLEQLMKPIVIKGISIEIGASIGVSLYPEHAYSLEKLIKTADEALYLVKNSGRGKIEIAPTPNPKHDRVIA